METYCGVCKFDLSLLYCVLLLICCFVMIGVNGHIPGWKEGEHMTKVKFLAVQICDQLCNWNWWHWWFKMFLKN